MFIRNTTTDMSLKIQPASEMENNQVHKQTFIAVSGEFLTKKRSFYTIHANLFVLTGVEWVHCLFLSPLVLGKM